MYWIMSSQRRIRNKRMGKTPSNELVAQSTFFLSKNCSSKYMIKIEKRKEFNKNTGKMPNSSLILEEDFVCLEVQKNSKLTIEIQKQSSEGQITQKNLCKTLKKVTKKVKKSHKSQK